MSRATWPLRVLSSLAWYTKKFVVSNLAVIWDIVTPTHLSHPQIVRYDTRCRTEWEVSLLSMLITLTPGTMVLATQETTPRAASGSTVAGGGPGRDPQAPRSFRIYVHSMFDDDPADVRAGTREMERRVLAAARPVDGAPAQEGSE